MNYRFFPSSVRLLLGICAIGCGTWSGNPGGEKAFYAASPRVEKLEGDESILAPVKNPNGKEMEFQIHEAYFGVSSIDLHYKDMEDETGEIIAGNYLFDLMKGRVQPGMPFWNLKSTVFRDIRFELTDLTSDLAAYHDPIPDLQSSTQLVIKGVLKNAQQEQTVVLQIPKLESLTYADEFSLESSGQFLLNLKMDHKKWFLFADDAIGMDELGNHEHINAYPGQSTNIDLLLDQIKRNFKSSIAVSAKTAPLDDSEPTNQSAAPMIRTFYSNSSVNSQILVLENVEAEQGDIALLMVANKSFIPLTQVQGFAADWKQIKAQCSSENQTGVSLYWAHIQSAGKAAITATLQGIPKSALISVVLIKGASQAEPIARSLALNAAGEDASCQISGKRSAEFSASLANVGKDSLVIGGLAHRLRTVSELNETFNQFAELHGTESELDSGDRSGLALFFARSWQEQEELTLSGRINSAIDWALVLVELK